MPEERAALAAEAFIYGFPLVSDLGEVGRFTRTGIGGVPAAPFNRFGHASQLAGPEATFVSINNDTVYSIAQVDLSGGPVRLDVPDTAGRYYVLQFVDAWTNNFAYVGQRATGTKQNGWNLTYHIFDYNLDFFEIGALDDPTWKAAGGPQRYLLRAGAARGGLWGNHGYEAAYAMAYRDADGNQLNGGSRYQLRFGQTPPVTAFWSPELAMNCCWTHAPTASSPADPGARVGAIDSTVLVALTIAAGLIAGGTAGGGTAPGLLRVSNTRRIPTIASIHAMRYMRTFSTGRPPPQRAGTGCRGG